MKKYEIPDATTLKSAIELMKSPEQAQKAKLVATVWSAMERKGFQKHLHLHIELGRSAVLVRRTQGGPIILGDMRISPTREFVKGLKETNESS